MKCSCLTEVTYGLTTQYVDKVASYVVNVGGVWVALVHTLLFFGECFPELVVCCCELFAVVVGEFLHCVYQVLYCGLDVC